jgi:hypothetical protein
MSQVLGFGFPAGARLRCDHPMCDELAEHTAKTPGPDGEKEIFGCSAHFEQMITRLHLSQRVKLRKPGERNPGELPATRPSGQS